MTNAPDADDPATDISLSPTPPGPDLIAAAEHLMAGRLGQAEPLCRAALKRDPLDINAMCLLADIGIRVGAFGDAEKLARRCLELAPDYAQARAHLANALFKRQRFAEAEAELDRLDRDQSGHPGHLVMRGNICAQTSRHEEALRHFQEAARLRPESARIFMSLGHTQKTLGDTEDAVTAYRRAAELEPTLGDAYWSRANLKTYRFTDDEVRQMQAAVSDPDIGRNDFLHLCFALGKALEDRKAYEEAFLHYRRGNQVRRRLVRYDPDARHAETLGLMDVFTPDLIATKSGEAARRPVPIFIVGLPRAGSTLIEQILASHSQVEGTQELPDIIAIARRLAGRRNDTEPSRYPQVIADMQPADLLALGDEYLERTAVYRTGSPFFIDKMPNNFAHLGLIRLILPEAIIIDARRHPMDCGFSCFKQLFARGQNFTYSLSDIGRYYADYVRLMRHWDAIMPGVVLRVLNEDMIADPEGQIRRLLDHCGLPFEQACLDFHRNARPVKTASSEQVREPVNAKGVGRWRPFEAHLGPLVAALGDTLETYRN
jgi:tetratricopeptide (TPR) repeat protein